MTLFRAFAASALIMAAPAFSADLVDATNPSEIMNLARGFGSASLDTDGEGDPMIVGRINGTRYVIYFYGCDDGRRCREIQFNAAWGGTGVTLTDINEWNETTRYGKAYLDGDGDPNIEFTVNLHKGVSRDNLEDTIDWWKVAMETFEDNML
ncbi:YbjN domain-containing protein [Ferrimonas balearica]|uniref:YbjN domain-containing protein n=1 Tax=Ferrimonas balearica TaxID=44012 RepID=UPI001C99BC35|nr:YbjN domain-containing protein [Ferrimonas balearica]MBY5992484.1 YbjN domain-containing protein [Ferrimonas balearica]